MRQNIFNAGIAFLFSCFVFSCNESSFLEEKPLDFLSPENAYNTYADYETALTADPRNAHMPTLKTFHEYLWGFFYF